MSSIPTPYAAVVALDWADRRHAWALATQAAETPQSGWLLNTPEAIHQFATQLGIG